MGAKTRAHGGEKAKELDEARDAPRDQSIEAPRLPCDLSATRSDRAMVSKVLRALRAGRHPLNNGRAPPGARPREHPLEAWQEARNLNLTGTFLVTQAVGKRSMIPNRYGRIVNVASIADCAATRWAC